ncbi:hypothetical protein BGX31_007067 [Mortierella sp. GBA43]|nr:hypothetical protein BGX31_007067 [Mortierella sp. GBA43]
MATAFYRCRSSLPDVPENIWLEIFGYLSLEEKFKAAGTCRTWNRILADPSLYTHIILDNMEFNTLIHTATAHHPFSQSGMFSLHTHITSFTPPRRREEYRKLGFTLHQDFSRALETLMDHSQDSIHTLDIHDNFLDLEMTDLVFCIVRYGRHLEHLLYDRNKDGGFSAPEVVSAITAACPNIKSFHGQHAISDTVLRRIMTGWEELRSLTLTPYQAPSVGTKEVSLEGLWSLLEYGKIESLELLDLDCISNESLDTMMQRVKQLKATSFERTANSPLSHPFAHHHSYFASLEPTTPSKPLPGESVRRLTITKYTSLPLTLPGFQALLQLFPNLESLSFTTNFFTYDYQFRGLPREIFDKEMTLVENAIQKEMTERWGSSRAAGCWQGNWDAQVTEEQRLRAGILQH